MINYRKELLEETITIIGSGLSGMASALAFAKNNNVTLISESNNYHKLPQTENRTIALTPTSLVFLQQILDSEGNELLQELINPINNIYVLDNKKSDKMLHFADTNKILGCIVPNADLKILLDKQIRTNTNINLVENSEISQIILSNSDFEHGAVYLNNGNYIKSNLIILCNGFKSSIYKKYFFPYLVKDYKQTALTFNIYHEKQHEFCAVEHFLPNGPFAILPLKNENLSSVVWTISNKLEKYLVSIPKLKFEYYVQENFGPFLGKICLASNVNSYPLIAYLNKKYFYKNLVLVADTAHIIHPLAGQGFNQGLKDISLLTKLYNENLNISEILTSYQTERELDNFLMFFITDNLNRLFSNNNRLFEFIRGNGLSIINKIPILKNYFQNYASGIR